MIAKHLEPSTELLYDQIQNTALFDITMLFSGPNVKSFPIQRYYQYTATLFKQKIEFNTITLK